MARELSEARDGEKMSEPLGRSLQAGRRPRPSRCSARSSREFQTPTRQGVPDTHAPESNAPMLGAPVLRPARSIKVFLVKKFPTQSSGHPFGDGRVSGTPPK
jgi:hypothetical protein